MCSTFEMENKTVFPIISKPIRKEKVMKIKPKQYNKFSSEKLESLHEVYLKNPYPSKELMETLSLTMKEKMGKLQNWFKHQRKKAVKNGSMKYERKNTFSKNQNNHLLELYEKKKNPTSQEYQEIANQINCKIKHVKHWFSYKRKLALKQQKLNRQETASSKTSSSQIFEEKSENSQLFINPSTNTSSSNSIYEKKFVKQQTNLNLLKTNLLMNQNQMLINKMQNNPNNYGMVLKCPVQIVTVPINIMPQFSSGFNYYAKNPMSQENMNVNGKLMQDLRMMYSQLIKNQQHLNYMNMALNEKLKN